MGFGHKTSKSSVSCCDFMRSLSRWSHMSVEGSVIVGLIGSSSCCQNGNWFPSADNLTLSVAEATWVKDQYPVVKMAIFYTQAKGLSCTQQCGLFYFIITKLAKICWLLPAVSVCVTVAKKPLRWRVLSVGCGQILSAQQSHNCAKCRDQTLQVCWLTSEWRGQGGTATLRLWPSFMVLETPLECKSRRRVPSFEGTFDLCPGAFIHQ